MNFNTISLIQTKNFKYILNILISTLAPAGLEVVRLSGKDAIKIADRFFKSFKKLESLKGLNY